MTTPAQLQRECSDYATVKSYIDKCHECDGLTLEEDCERTIEALRKNSPELFQRRKIHDARRVK
jgi:rRNA maturation protein Nop10